MRSSLRFVSVAAIAAMLAAVPGSAQKTTGPKERYEMDVATASGFAAMTAGGRKPGVGGMMGMMFGGGPDNQVARTIELRLGSNQPPNIIPIIPPIPGLRPPAVMAAKPDAVATSIS